MKDGRLAEACAALEASQKLEPTPNTLINLAGCREKLGQIATAWGLFLDAARQTRSARDPVGRQAHDVARTRALRLEPRISKLTVNVSLKSQFDGLEILRGAERLEPALWNRALPVDGGTYKITARAPGANPWTTEVTVAAEGDSKTVEIPDLRNLPRDLDVQPAPSPPPAPAAKPVAATAAQAADQAVDVRTSSNVVPLVVGAGALALVGTGVGFELSARSRYSAYKAETTDLSRRETLYDAANTRRYVAGALAVGGVVAGGAAVWLYLRGRHREHAPASAAVLVVPTATGLALSGQF